MIDSKIEIKIKRTLLLLLCLVIVCGGFFSCNKERKIEALDRKKLFMINYGSFEDELDLFNIGTAGEINTYLQMKDGFFFIVNGKSKKLLHFTSYGDLLTIIYNSEANPPPSFVNSAAGSANSTSAKTGTQRAVAYPFNSMGKIAVDKRKYIYVVDKLPPERQEQDKEKHLLLREVVLRFSSDGTFIDYLGQQGPGGTPFPYISNLYTTKNNELVVVSVTGTGCLVNWFSSDGFLRFSIPLDTDKMPNPYEGSSETYLSVDSVVPDYTSNILYLKIDYYKSEIDSQSKVQSGIVYSNTLLYPLSVDTGLFEEPVPVPPFEVVENNNFNQKVYPQTYELLGVTESRWFFFIVPDETGYTIQIMQNNGQKTIKKHLQVSAEELVYNSFCLSNEGIVSALLADNFEASVVWWRTDALIDAVIK